MMELIKLKVEDFKRVHFAELELGDVNILVGCNGSGKSSIIQAVHLACCVMRQAPRIEPTKTSTVGIDELDYLPTNNYHMLGCDSDWGNKAGSPSSRVSLSYLIEGVEVVASSVLRSARNAGISISGNMPSQLFNVLRNSQKFFSAYIPGISGIPNKEEKKSKKVVLKACSYGDSNIILRNVLLLLKPRISIIEEWISQIIGPVKIIVNHVDDKHLFIDCNIEINGSRRPIELIGTGHLQLIQIFAYILLFEPGILLIDEPDIHLHPTVQEKLIKVLANVAREKGLRVLLTTHSPFIVRGAPTSANVYWVNNGTIESGNRREVELALGWGAFGKKIIIVSEDTELGFLKKIISQWPELDKYITFYPGTGYKHITTPQQASDIDAALGNKYKIVVHRDRDSLTDIEVEMLTQQYAEKGISLWFPELSDLESYFCRSQFLEDFLGYSETEAVACLEEVLASYRIPCRAQFDSQRAAHNEELYKTGGSPQNENVWAEFQTRPLRGAKGKRIFCQLKNKIGNRIFNENAIQSHNITVEIAPDLKTTLEQLLME